MLVWLSTSHRIRILLVENLFHVKIAWLLLSTQINEGELVLTRATLLLHEITDVYVANLCYHTKPQRAFECNARPRITFVIFTAPFITLFNSGDRFLADKLSRWRTQCVISRSSFANSLIFTVTPEWHPFMLAAPSVQTPTHFPQSKPCSCT